MGCERTISNLDFGKDGSINHALSLDSTAASTLGAAKQGVLTFTLQPAHCWAPGWRCAEQP